MGVYLAAYAGDIDPIPVTVEMQLILRMMVNASIGGVCTLSDAVLGPSWPVGVS
jgi:hypothetical protein